ncbi:acyl-CoA synthetase [Anoxybacillus kestanbolensis]|uniref:acyl-CoA synthetase n=1 Tax=Anoxybacillus kestanbolensis TaxID=227476 RepID=UPI003D243EEE
MYWAIDWLNKRATLTPNRVAVVDGEKKVYWTYEQLNEEATNLAHSLKQLGIQKGDRVALLSPNDISYFHLLFACTKIGAVFVPVNWRLSKGEISYILSDCQPSLFIYDRKLGKLVPETYKGKKLELQSDTYNQLFVGHGEIIEEKVNVDDPLTIIYTGGTTGLPKGAVLTHQSMFYNIINTINSWNLTTDDTTLTYLPMFHTGGLNVLSLPLLHIGGKVVFANKFEPERAVRLLNEEKCTIVLFVPTMYHLLIQSKAFQQSDFPTVHTFLSGGAPCSNKIYAAFAEKGLTFKEGYGLTEAGPNNFFINPQDVYKRRGSVGKPMLYNTVKIVNEEGKETGPGEVGEIVISGYHLFSRYWNKPDVTAETLKDGWLYTGDLGKRDEEGFFYIVGRKKDMIITGGENVYPVEVEHVIAECEAVAEVAVVGLPDETWGEIVTAFVVLKEGMIMAADEIKNYCRKSLGSYKVPKRIELISEIPKTPVGKIDKQALVSFYGNQITKNKK